MIGAPENSPEDAEMFAKWAPWFVLGIVAFFVLFFVLLIGGIIP